MRKFTKGLLILVTVLCAGAFLLTALTPYISPVSFWPMTFIALGFPVITIGFCLIIFLWLFFNWRVALFLLIFLIIAGFKNLHSTFGLNKPTAFHYQKSSNTLRVLDWNVRYFDNNDRWADSPTSIRRQMINYLRQANADVMLFQDYLDYPYNPAMYYNKATIRDSLGYKYCYTTKDYIAAAGQTENGVAIYSKLPITDTGKTIYPGITESVGYADIKFQGKTVRFYTTHLLSMGIHPKAQYKSNDLLNKDGIRYGESVTRTLKEYDQIHANQAMVVREQVSKSPYPVIVTGDFNSVPSSFVYHTIKGDLQDAFVKKGFKLGHTYVGLSKTLRIDYVLVDPALKITQFTSPRLFLSDHFPVIADVQWK